MTTTHGQFGPNGSPAGDAPDGLPEADTDPQVVLDRLGSGFDGLFTHEPGKTDAGKTDAGKTDAGKTDATDSEDQLDPPAAPAGGGRRRKPILVGAGSLVCALAIGGGTVAVMHKTVSISVDGVTQDVSTLAGSVDGALDAAGLTIAPSTTRWRRPPTPRSPTGRTSLCGGAGC